MRRAVIVALLTLGIGCAAPPRTVPAPATAAPPLGAVTAEELRRDLYAFADDSMHGRETGTEDVTRALRFLVDRLTRLGLEPAGDSGFAQRVPMQKEVFGPGTRIAVEEAGARLERLGKAIEAQLRHWRWRPVVEALQALRGLSVIHAVRIVAELGDFNRFEAPRKLMGYLGLIPSEDSSGPRRRQGAITKAGNSSARRALIEAAHAYAHPARVSWVIARRQSGLSKRVTDIAWKAQLRLCARFRRLAARKLARNKIVVAIARELCGFVWAIARQVQPAH